MEYRICIFRNKMQKIIQFVDDCPYSFLLLYFVHLKLECCYNILLLFDDLFILIQYLFTLIRMGCTTLCARLFKQKQNTVIVDQQIINRNDIRKKKISNDKTEDRLQQNEDQEFKSQLRILNHLTKGQIDKKFTQVRRDQKYFYQVLSQDMTNFYMDLSKEALQQLNLHRKTDNQAKLFISQQMLLLSLDIFQVMGKTSNYQYQKQTFERFNEVQGQLMSFLKAKYPRAGNIFVPGDLNQKFKNFDMVNNYQNQIFRNSNTNFNNCTKKFQIVNKLKEFFNTLFQQLDKTYPRFQKLLQQQVFYYQQQGKQINLSYKVNRKIPQNVARFEIDDSQQMIISSPQLFRTIIKWNQYLQQLISDPEQSIKKKQTFNVYKFRQGKYTEQIVNVEQISDIIPQLVKRFANSQQLYSKSLREFRQQIGAFNTNLLKILNTTKRKQKFIPKSDASVIKYAYFNMHVVSWVVKEILIFLIQQLIQVGKHLTSHGKQINVNLITFLVSDLMRSMVTGSKKQILYVFNNILQLQKKGQIKVIKVKNRLGTLLNDAMIIFRIKDSFIICQLQLVLSEGSGASQKLKYIQTMHHYFYELQRSPYGVLSQIAVLLGFKDSRIAYSEKIGFDRNLFFTTCQKNHPQRIKNQLQQKNPIICITCSQFYNPYQNMFMFKKCQECFIYQCCTCTFAKDKVRRLQEIDKKFNKKFLETVNYKIDFNQLFVNEKVQLRQIRNPSMSINGHDLHKYLKQKKYSLVLKNDQIQKQNQVVFLLVRFKGIFVKFKQFFWNKQIQQFQNCFVPSQVISEMNKVALSQFDFLYFFKTQKMININQNAQVRYRILSIEKNLQIRGIQKYFIIQVDDQHAYLLRFQKNNDKNFVNFKIPSQILAKKKSFGYQSITQARKNYPKFAFVQQNFSMVNCGITSPLIQKYFSQNAKLNKHQSQNIKQVNLSNNLIGEISSLFSHCPNIQKVILSQNFIKQINFARYKLPFIQYLILNNNILQDIQGLNQLKTLQKLKLGNNQLTDIQILHLPQLRQLNISYNLIDSIQWLQQSHLPNLITLDTTSSGISKTKSHQGQSLRFEFPKLNQFIFNDNIAGIINIKSQSLQHLSANHCDLHRINMKTDKIINLSICDNSIKNLDDIISSRMPNAKVIKCYKAGELPVLPIINAQKLLVLNLAKCEINNVNNLKKSNIPQINEIDLSDNENIKRIPKVQFKNLRIFNTEGISLKNIDFLYRQVNQQDQAQSYSNQNRHNFQKLEQLIIKGQALSRKSRSASMRRIQNQKQLECPTLNLQHLNSLRISDFPFQNIEGISRSSLPNLKNLILSSLNVNYLSKISFDKLQYLKLEEVQIQKSSKQFQQSSLPEVKCIQVQNSSINSFQLITQKPKLDKIICFRLTMPKIQQIRLVQAKILSLRECKIQDITGFQKCWLPQILQIDLSSNRISHLPNLKMTKLKSLNLSKNIIKDLCEFSESNVPNLENMNISFNSIAQIPKLKFRLKHFIVDFNPLQNLQDIFNCKLENLEQLRIVNLSNLNNEFQIPRISLKNVKQLIIINSNLRNFQKILNIQLPQVQKFLLSSRYPIKLPKLKLPRLKKFSVSFSLQNNQQQILKEIQEFKTFQNIDYKKKDVNKDQKIDSDLNREFDDLNNLAIWQSYNLKSIQLKNLNLKSLPKISMAQLEHFIIRSTYLNSIEQFRKSELQSLQKLVLFRVKRLKNFKISDSIISGGKIFIVETEIQNIDGFQKSNCSEIFFQGNNIKQLGVMELKQAQTLSLNYNSLSNINFIRYCPYLKILRLKGNNIKQISTQVYFQELSSLLLSYNNIQDISLNSSKFPKLQYLILNKNKIKTISKISIKTLHEFHAKNNQIYSIDFFNQNTKYSLSNINCKFNEITKVIYIPPTKNISLENNPIKTLSWIKKSNSMVLQSLVISNAQIKDFGIFGQSTHNFSQLFKLDLSFNQGNYFPSVMTPFLGLNQLNLSHNNFTQLSEFPFNNFPLLQKLDLSFNFLTQFKTQLKKLKHLFLNDNQLTYIFIDNSSLQLLRELMLDNNQLTDLKIMKKCPCLLWLSARNNYIRQLPNLSNNLSLKLLNLEGNPLQNLSDFLTTNFQELDQFQFKCTRQQLSQQVYEIINNKVNIDITNDVMKFLVS